MRLRMIGLPSRLDLGVLSDNAQNPVIAEVKARLCDRGLYSLDLDDIYNQDIRDAIARFQELEKITVTGELDPVTYCRLLAAAESEITPSTTPKKRAAASIARPNILITKSVRRLTLFSGNSPIRQYPVAIGKPSTPTPLGNYAIATKVVNPGGVLGSRWMGLNYDTYGIHGTNRPWLIGQMVSNGCIRMHNANAEDIFSLIPVGTPVFIRD